MELFASFLITVAAGVACHYIIKWLDGDDKSNKLQDSSLFHKTKMYPYLVSFKSKYKTYTGNALLPFVWRDSPSEMEGSRPALYHLRNLLHLRPRPLF